MRASGANSPTWHGASPDHAGHRNAGAQWGIRSKEFGGNGYNQLLFDDTDHQGRIQLKTTSASSELNLGHLVHSADNYRGSLRGLRAEYDKRVKVAEVMKAKPEKIKGFDTKVFNIANQTQIA